MTYADHRSIPLDVLRDFVISQCEITSIRHVAAEVAVGRTTIHHFIHSRTKPQPRIRRILGLWFLKKMAEAPDIDIVRPYEAAITVLLSSIPAQDKETARAGLVEGLAEIHGEERPRWLQLLLKA